MEEPNSDLSRPSKEPRQEGQYLSADQPIGDVQYLEAPMPELQASPRPAGASNGQRSTFTALEKAVVAALVLVVALGVVLVLLNQHRQPSLDGSEGTFAVQVDGSTQTPTENPTEAATEAPTVFETATPSPTPAQTPVATDTPTAMPTETPTVIPTDTPIVTPTAAPEVTPTAETAVVSWKGWSLVTGGNTLIYSSYLTETILHALNEQDAVYVTGQLEHDERIWCIVQVGDEWGYIPADQLRKMSEEEEKDYLDSLATPSPEPSPTPTKRLGANDILRGWKENNETYQYLLFGHFMQETGNDDPLLWRILTVDHTSQRMLLLSEKIIFAYPYGSEVWENSNVHAWLNGPFVSSAFDQREMALIYKGNSRGTIFILSRDDLLNDAYGFSTSTAADPARAAEATTYARDSGLLGAPYYTLTKNNETSMVAVMKTGRIQEVRRDRNDVGIRPALWIDFAKLDGTITGEGTTTSPFMIR